MYLQNIYIYIRVNAMESIKKNSETDYHVKYNFYQFL